MPYYESFDPNAEVLGRNVMAFLTNMNHEDMADIVRKHGLTQVDPDQWYRLQPILDVLSEISESPNGMTNIVSLGIASSNLIYNTLPPAIRNLSLADFLMRYDELIRGGSRSSDPGEIKVQQESERHITVTYRVPYPDDLFYGFFYGFTRLFRPEGKSFSVKYDPQLARREEGGHATRLHILVDA